MSEAKKYEGSCHCGKIRFEVKGKLEGLMRCNCSICRRRAHVLWFVPKDNVTFLAGEDEMGEYQFGEKIITHRFCKHCGVAILSDGEMNGIVKAGMNLLCIDGLNLGEFDIMDYDGASA